MNLIWSGKKQKWNRGADAWPPSTEELVANLRSAVLKQPAAGKTRAYPFQTAWGQLMWTCHRALSGQPEQIFEALVPAFSEPAEHDALLRKIVEMAPCEGDPFVFPRTARTGDALGGIDWTRGLAEVIACAKLLEALGLGDEAEDLAVEGYQVLANLVASFAGHPGAAGLLDRAHSSLMMRPFSIAGFDRVQEWAEQNLKTLAKSKATTATPPSWRTGSFSRLAERLQTR